MVNKDVVLKFENAPPGYTLNPDRTIRRKGTFRSDQEVTQTIQATNPPPSHLSEQPTATTIKTPATEENINELQNNPEVFQERVIRENNNRQIREEINRIAREEINAGVTPTPQTVGESKPNSNTTTRSTRTDMNQELIYGEERAPEKYEATFTITTDDNPPSKFTKTSQRIKEKLFSQRTTDPLTTKEIIYTAPAFLSGGAKVAKDFTKGFVIGGLYETGKALTVNIDETVGGFVTLGADLLTGEKTAKGVLKTGLTAANNELRLNPAEFAGKTTFLVSLPTLIKKAPKIRARAANVLDKHLDSKPYYTESIGTGIEIHKGGGFAQELLIYKGQTIQRGGKTFGVRRVKKPSWKSPSSYIDKWTGKKPGQIKYFDVVGQDIVIRNVPSQFATAADALGTTGRNQLMASVTPDSSFIKGQKSYRVIQGGEKTLETIKGRAGAGGDELNQFFSVETVRPITTSTGRVVPAGTPQVYRYYAGLGDDTSYLDLLTGKAEFKLIPPKPGIIFAQERIARVKNPGKKYVDLAQEQAGYTEPGVFNPSASTLKQVRSEAEVTLPVGSEPLLKSLPDINIGEGSFRTAYATVRKPSTLKAYKETLVFNKEQLTQRISKVEEFSLNNPGQEAIANTIIQREYRNIARIDKALQEKSLSSVKNSLRSSPDKNSLFESATVEQEILLNKAYAYSSKPRAANPYSVSSSLSRDLRGSVLIPSNNNNNNLVSSSSSNNKYSSIKNSLPSASINNKYSSVVSFDVSASKAPSSSLKTSSSKSSKSSRSSSSSPYSSSLSTPSVTKSFSAPSVSKVPSYASPSSARSSNYYPPRTVYTPIFNAPSRLTNSDRSKGFFTTQVLEKGKYVTIGSARTQEKAFNLGSVNVGGRALRSFRVLKGGTPVRLTETKRFRRSKSKPFALVEKSRYAINTGGEVREISGKSRKSRGFF